MSSVRVVAAFITLVIAGCGDPKQGARPDSGTGLAPDASADAGLDAPVIGTLTPDPTDLLNPPCSGLLGFPNAPTVRFNSGNAVAVIDIDADGHQDIIVSGSSDIRITRGFGNGTFAATTSMTTNTPSGAYNLRVTDLTGDGKPDLVFTVGSEVRVAANAGAGTFATPVTLVSSLGQTSIQQLEIVDLDGNGKKDVIALAEANQIAVVVLNSANGFTAPQSYSVGASGYAPQLAAGDITGDGKADLVVTNAHAATVSVLVNNGAGSFSTRVTYPTPPIPQSVVLVDANEDGHLDIIVGTEEANQQQLTVLLNAGTGTFGTATSFAFGSGYGARSLAAADVNADGHVDIALAGFPPSRIAFGTGTGQFSGSFEFPRDEGMALAFADVQGDGRPDAVLSSYTLVTVYLNRGGSEPFETRTTLSFGVSTANSRGARMLDFSSDGRLDLVALGSSSSAPTATASTRLATGPTSFGSTTTYATIHGALGARTMVSDLNNDNRSDLVLVGHDDLQALINNGDGTLSPTPVMTLDRDTQSAAIADLDGDGVRDIVIAHGDINTAPNAGAIGLYRGLGNGQFAGGTTVWSGGTGMFGVAVVDANHDGKLDIVGHSYAGDFRQDVLLGLGNGQFSPGAVTMEPRWPQYGLYVRDINKDGNADLVGFADGVSVMLGNGIGGFGVPIRSAALNIGGDAAFADFNGDGKLDVIAPGGGSVCVLHGRGDGTFAPAACYPSGPAFNITLGDVDGDGWIDVLVNGSQDRVSIMYGRCIQS